MKDAFVALSDGDGDDVTDFVRDPIDRLVDVDGEPVKETVVDFEAVIISDALLVAVSVREMLSSCVTLNDGVARDSDLVNVPEDVPVRVVDEVISLLTLPDSVTLSAEALSIIEPLLLVERDGLLDAELVEVISRVGVTEPEKECDDTLSVSRELLIAGEKLLDIELVHVSVGDIAAVWDVQRHDELRYIELQRET